MIQKTYYIQDVDTGQYLDFYRGTFYTTIIRSEVRNCKYNSYESAYKTLDELNDLGGCGELQDPENGDSIALNIIEVLTFC